MRCERPIADMQLNRKHRSITWVCDAEGPGGDPEQGMVGIPKAYDLEGIEMLADDFENGICRISVPKLGAEGGIF